MGHAHVYTCRQCGGQGKIHLSIGMAYPYVCEETKQAAIAAKLGTALQKYVAEHPNGAFDCENVVFACSCGGWKTAPRLDYYVPEDGQELPPYFTGDANFKGTVRRAQHRCPKCRKKLQELPEKKITSLRCPLCSGNLKFDPIIIRWD